MDKILLGLKNPRGRLNVKSPSPSNWKGNDLLDAALKNFNSPNLDSLLISFHNLMPNTTDIENQLPVGPSGYITASNGVIPKVIIYKEPHGVYCQNEAHLGSFENVTMNGLICKQCVESGPQMKSTHDKWSLKPLIPITSTAPIFLLVLVSRSSDGKSIKQEIFEKLKKMVIKNNEKILHYIKSRTGITFELHILEEIGQHGSIFSNIKDCVHHVRDGGQGLHLPASHISDLFWYNKTKVMQFGYVMNHPGDLSGKLSNHAHNLRYLENGGIDPSNVHFLSYGVRIGIGEKSTRGVIEDFTIFSGDALLQKAEYYMREEVEKIPECHLPNIDGFITGMYSELGPRHFRNSTERKKQAGQEH